MRWGGQVYVESEYPNLIFLKDGELFKIEGSQYLVLGGGYSSDYFSRMLNNEGWWPDEERFKASPSLWFQRTDPSQERVVPLS